MLLNVIRTNFQHIVCVASVSTKQLSNRKTGIFCTGQSTNYHQYTSCQKPKLGTAHLRKGQSSIQATRRQKWSVKRIITV